MLVFSLAPRTIELDYLDVEQTFNFTYTFFHKMIMHCLRRRVNLVRNSLPSFTLAVSIIILYCYVTFWLKLFCSSVRKWILYIFYRHKSYKQLFFSIFPLLIDYAFHQPLFALKLFPLRKWAQYFMTMELAMQSAGAVSVLCVSGCFWRQFYRVVLKLLIIDYCPPNFWVWANQACVCLQNTRETLLWGFLALP